ncbi:hypothetical protein CC2G_015291 [Coprinopsis cinerea AmutBmut pab1-1]|nr:hypothetical protein CC2G_015291 [Coprinopsis cinerea AmutBmut pab1-1]KAG2002978.1 hypothetical protein CC2G_015291 [Coprinopsis cinerea AmutBmut pab1-1]
MSKLSFVLFSLLSLSISFISPRVGVGAASVSTCVNDCFVAAASEGGCASIDDIECLKASPTFESIAAKCIADNRCTELTDSDEGGDSARATFTALSVFDALAPAGHQDGYANGTPVRRSALFGPGAVSPASNLAKRQCNTGRGLCVSGGESRCRAYCQSCHVDNQGRCGVDCTSGLCTGFLGLTCACQVPCFLC